MANRKRRLLTTKETIQAIPLEKENVLKLIEQEHPQVVPPAPPSRQIEQSIVEHHVVEKQDTEDKQHVEDQVQMTDSATPTKAEHFEAQAEGSSTRKPRGKTQMHKNNQPVSPTDDVVTELGSFFSTLARKTTLCPLNIFDWRHMDTKLELWEYTQAKYDIPDATKHWVLERIRESWRKNRNDLKRDHYDPYDDDVVRLKNNLDSVLECQFKDLLVYWKSEKFQENEKGESLFLKEMFVVTRARKPDRTYKSSNEDTSSKIAQMEEIEIQQGENEKPVDAFSAVMDVEHPGCVRLLGRGVTKTSLGRLNDSSGQTLNTTNDVVQQMQERMQKMEDQIEDQKRTIR